MLIFVLITLNIILLISLGISCFYLVRFARIIFSIEDHLEVALNTFLSVQESLENLLQMKLFFDSKEVKQAADEALSEVKLSRVAVTSLINDFTKFSKQKYITTRTDEEEEEKKNSEE
jgi:hypothetical protein